MTRVFATALIAAALFATPAVAQQLELPRLSPNAKIVQNVGLTEISIEYSSPGVHGRPIWGALVPYDVVWRAGANSSTKVTFSKDVTFGGTAVPAGSYSLFVIPSQSANWIVILSKDPNQPGTFNYKKELDLLRLEVKPEAIPLRERLAYLITDFTEDAATLSLEWEKVRISVPLKTATKDQVDANLKAYEDGAWMPYNSAARFELDQRKDYDAGLAYVEKSLRIKEDWMNTWTKAQLLAAKGKTKDACPLAQKAQQLGEKAPRFVFAEEVKKALVEWKCKK
jgi:hypothetical protein